MVLTVLTNLRSGAVWGGRVSCVGQVAVAGPGLLPKVARNKHGEVSRVTRKGSSEAVNLPTIVVGRRIGHVSSGGRVATHFIDCCSCGEVLKVLAVSAA